MLMPSAAALNFLCVITSLLQPCLPSLPAATQGCSRHQGQLHEPRQLQNEQRQRSIRRTIGRVRLSLKADESSVGAGPMFIIHADNITNADVSRRFMGCHSDPGFVHTPRGFSSNLVVGSSFGLHPFLCSRGGHMDHHSNCTPVKSWTHRIGAGVINASIGLAPAVVFSTRPSMKIEAAIGEVAVVNRGLGGAGFALQNAMSYEFQGWFLQDTSAKIFAELRDFNRNISLSRIEFNMSVVSGPDWGANWAKVNFSLVPNASTKCHTIVYGSDPLVDCGHDPKDGDAHPCMVCGGELLVGLVDGGKLNVGYVSLQPGVWGRVRTQDGSALPVLRQAGEILSTMGTTIIRNGGSVAQAIRWKDWRGPMWNRPSAQLAWGDSLIAGWGIFEQIDFANALGIEPIISLAYDLNDALDLGDLIEYCYGSANTSWGRRRIVDGHSAPYRVSAFELGNEQSNPMFLDQVLEMENRAKSLGSSEVPELRYIYPGVGTQGLSKISKQRAVALRLPIERIATDLHVGSSGAVAAARALFAADPDFHQDVVNLETNAMTHDLGRALSEAADLIDFFTSETAVTGRIWARTASFCSQSSSQFDRADQGLSFFNQEQAWLQPPGHVHAMISQTWAEQTLWIEKTAAAAGLQNVSVAAQRTRNRQWLIMRAVNAASFAQRVVFELQRSIVVADRAAKDTNYTSRSWVLQGTDLAMDNSPESPHRCAPVVGPGLVWEENGTRLIMELPALSFSVHKQLLVKTDELFSRL